MCKSRYKGSCVFQKLKLQNLTIFLYLFRENIGSLWEYCFEVKIISRLFCWVDISRLKKLCNALLSSQISFFFLPLWSTLCHSFRNFSFFLSVGFPRSLSFFPCFTIDKHLKLVILNLKRFGANSYIQTWFPFFCCCKCRYFVYYRIALFFMNLS